MNAALKTAVDEVSRVSSRIREVVETALAQGRKMTVAEGAVGVEFADALGEVDDIVEAYIGALAKVGGFAPDAAGNAVLRFAQAAQNYGRIVRPVYCDGAPTQNFPHIDHKAFAEAAEELAETHAINAFEVAAAFRDMDVATPRMRDGTPIRLGATIHFAASLFREFPGGGVVSAEVTSLATGKSYVVGVNGGEFTVACGDYALGNLDVYLTAAEAGEANAAFMGEAS